MAADDTRLHNARPETVRALTRGLEVLRYINAAGDAKVSEIAADLGLARPTVYRLLQTLTEEGYITQSDTGARVRVTRLAASLGDGYAATSMVCQAAAPIFAEFAPKLIWPLDLSVYENAHMVIQETTHGRSPLSIDRGMTGYRLPILRTSAGRAYLGHCDDAERDLILNYIRRLGDPYDTPFLKPERLDPMLREVRERGYAIRASGVYRHKTSSVAVPVFADQTIVAVVSLIWIRNAMTLTDAIATYVKPLQDIAGRVTAAMKAARG